MTKPSLRQWMYYLLLTPFFKPAILGVLEGTDWLENIFDLWRMAAAVGICGLYLYQMIKRRRGPSPVLIFLWLYLGCIAVSTLIREDNLWSLINYVMTIGIFGVLLELSLRDDPVMAVNMLVMPLTVLILINFILLCLYPNGLCWGGTYGYSYNFLGIDNFLAPILVPYMFFTVLRSSMVHGKVNWFAYAMVVVSAVSLLLVWSATGLMGLLVALVFLLFFYEHRWQTLFNFDTALGLGGGLFFSIVLFRLQNIFAFFIEGVLHKGLSFTGRTDIWDKAIAMILESPFLGYGIAQSGKVYRLSKHKYYHAHNAFLEVMVEGGVFALIAFLLMIERAGRQLMIYRKHPYACLLAAGLMAAAVMTTMEPFLDSNGLLIYALVFFSYYVGTLIAGKPVPAAGSH
jgi:hypothetical protein